QGGTGADVRGGRVTSRIPCPTQRRRQLRSWAGHSRFARTLSGARAKERISNLLPVTIGTRGEDDEPRNYESLQSDDPGPGLRPDPDLDCVPGEDSVLVLRRNQEAGDHQLPDLQAGA